MGCSGSSHAGLYRAERQQGRSWKILKKASSVVKKKSRDSWASSHEALSRRSAAAFCRNPPTWNLESRKKLRSIELESPGRLVTEVTRSCPRMSYLEVHG